MRLKDGMALYLPCSRLFVLLLIILLSIYMYFFVSRLQKICSRSDYERIVKLCDTSCPFKMEEFTSSWEESA